MYNMYVYMWLLRQFIKKIQERNDNDRGDIGSLKKLGSSIEQIILYLPR